MDRNRILKINTSFFTEKIMGAFIQELPIISSICPCMVQSKQSSIYSIEPTKNKCMWARCVRFEYPTFSNALDFGTSINYM